MTTLALPLTPRSWQRRYLGCSRLVLRTHDGLELVLDHFDGEGAGRGYGVWRMAGRMVLLVAAGEA